MNKKIPVVDIFAGPGGLGEGFSARFNNKNENVFDIVLSVEKDPVAHKTLELRSFYRKFSRKRVPEEYYQYIRRELSRDKLFESYPEEASAAKSEAWCNTLGSGDEFNCMLDDRLKKLSNIYRDRWVLIGGPPCQAYSTVGRARRRSIEGYKAEDDKRNFLYLEYLRILAEHQPSVFVMENVKGMLSSKINGSSIFNKILNDLKSPCQASELKTNNNKKIIEYDVFSLAVRPDIFSTVVGSFAPKEFVIQSEKYGIPQKRHRVILLGVKKGVFSNKPLVLESRSETSSSQVLEGLPPLRSGLSREKDTIEKWKSVILDSFDRYFEEEVSEKEINHEFQMNIKSALDELDDCDLDRGAEFVEGEVTVKEDLSWWYLDERIGGACNHTTKSHMNSDLHRYLFASCFAEHYGRSPIINDFPEWLVPNHRSAKTGHFSDRFRVQLADQPSTTITSHIAKDGHYYIHYNPVQCRSLTVREAARLQTFPDNYFFEGNRTQQYTQVGNAVPPLLARKIAGIVEQLFDNSKYF